MQAGHGPLSGFQHTAYDIGCQSLGNGVSYQPALLWARRECSIELFIKASLWNTVLTV